MSAEDVLNTVHTHKSQDSVTQTATMQGAVELKAAKGSKNQINNQRDRSPPKGRNGEPLETRGLKLSVNQPDSLSNHQASMDSGDNIKYQSHRI